MRFTSRSIASSALILAVATTACGGNGGYLSYDIADAPLAGTVGGAPWTFMNGEISAFLSDDEDFFGELYATAYETCDLFGTDADPLLVAIPTEVGDYEMSLSRNMTFVVGDDNLIAIEGRIVVDAITPTSVSGGLYGRYNDDNEVSGRFEIARCPE